MKKSFRLTVLACAAALALAVVALAAADYQPSMGIFQATYKPNGAGAVTVVVAQQQNNDPTAKLTIYTPAAYSVTLGQPAGTQIGDAVAEIQLLDISSKPLPFSGAVKADTPANWATLAAACTGVPTHEAVWTLNLSLAGQTDVIPIFVDHTTGPEAAFASVKLQVCFRDPTLPQGDPRRSPSGAKFNTAAITLRGIFRNPAVPGLKLWRTLFTPYTPGTGNPNVAGTKEAQGVVPMPYSVSLKRTHKHVRRGFYRVAGTVNRAGKAPSGVTIALYSATATKGTPKYAVVARTKTKKGKFAFQRRLPSKVTVVFAEREPLQIRCAATVSPAPCSASIESNAISSVLKIAPRKKH